MTTYDAFKSVLRSRQRDVYGPQTASEKMDAQMDEDPSVKFRNRIAKQSAVIARTQQPGG